MQYRGYFYTPITSQYTFNFTKINAIAILGTGSKAVSGWTRANEDDEEYYVTTTGVGSFIFNTTIQAGTYLSSRVQHSDAAFNGASLMVNIYDSSGNYCVVDETPSNYFLHSSCGSNVASEFPAWGSEGAQ
ncbi:hypothetical protein TWF694_007151 [Orbilia ellipsospora]|uniref:GLEYA adhesin domain-containing protein n=1 Tax=Orbilia ellipsospora TaxID=2528407 RepID=A0AAV9XIC3_9PEZI